MNIRPATRSDLPRIVSLLATRGWDDTNTLDRDAWFVAEEGERIVGCTQIVEAEPGRWVVDQVLVDEQHREKGVGRALITAALEGREGSVFLCCHEERLRFYGHFGFTDIGFEKAPPAVQDYWRLIEDYPTDEDHVHFFLRRGDG